MGKPLSCNDDRSVAEYIGNERRTQGSETSQYLKEKTTRVIPRVVASERGGG